MQQLAGLGIDRRALIDALAAQNAITPAGVVETPDQKHLDPRHRRVRVRRPISAV